MTPRLDSDQRGSALEEARDALRGFDEQRPDGRHHLRDAVDALIRHAAERVASDEEEVR